MEDHPLEYGSFEGIIPKGHYGAGTVMIWDQGTYLERTSKDKAESEKKMQLGLEKGHLTFLLSGEKLRGEFALVKLRDKKSANAWLLVKKRDQYSSFQPITEVENSVSTGRSIQDIKVEAPKQSEVWIPKKGPTKPVDMQKKSAKAFPGAIAAMRPVALNRPMSECKFPTGEWCLQLADLGKRMLVTRYRSRIAFYSAHGMPLEAKNFDEVVTQLNGVQKDFIFDGELVERSGHSIFLLADVLYFGDTDLRQAPLSDRQAVLKKLSRLKLPMMPTVVIDNSVEDALQALRKRDGSQTAKSATAKHLVSYYHSGVDAHWVKFKLDKNAAVESLAPQVTNPDKVYWPEAGYTKKDLVEYYDSIATWILPHLKDRPLSLNRYPNGIHGESFYQKDVTGYVPRWLERVRVYSNSARKSIDYAMCQNRESLLYLANLGCIEMNPWLARQQDLTVPDWSIIDIDPDEQEFSVVRETALQIYDVIKQFKLPSHVKTSGASGIHIYIPLSGEPSFDDARVLAQHICQIVAHRLPKLTTLERNPQKRRRRIYLDCLQNRKGQTLAAPYCLRPTVEASVATPLNWKDLEKPVVPQDFTIKNTLARLKKKGDLWSEMMKDAVDIKVALAAFSKKL